MAVIPVSTRTCNLVDGPPQGQWTYDDWIKLDTEHNRYRYEVIDGVLYLTDVPPVRHQGVVSQLMRWFLSVEDRKNGQYVSTFVATVMPDNIVVPDFLIYHVDRVQIKEYLHGTPDLICEVLYPGHPSYDEGI